MHPPDIDNRALRRGRKGPFLVIAGLLGAGVAAACALWALGQKAEPEFKPVRVVAPLPPIVEFPTRPVREVRDELNPSELVLGVTVGKESRAYPINMLTGPQREILNDTLGGRAIAATW